MSNNLKEYIITLHRKEDLEEFYQDMETLRATPYNCMPERAVDCHNRRPISRNTHYMLTEEEAEILRKDPRIQAVMLTPKELGIKVRRSWIDTSSLWNKSLVLNNAHKNWGLLRSVEGEQRAGWGSDNTTSQSGTISISEEGRNVDVIIVDGHVNPNHPEFAVNSDGTGGSRVIQFDWHTLTTIVSGTDDDGAAVLTSSYVYTPYTGGVDEGDNNHGCHVAGTVAGNSHGWARAANIYNISPYSTNPNGLDELALFDYIRAFHNNKAINPATGRRNPTICNHSWGYGYEVDTNVETLSSVFFRGSTINGPFTDVQLRTYGILASGGILYAPADYPALRADAEDSIADGIIMVAAASNDYTKVDLPGGQDYDNYFVSTFSGLGPYSFPYHKGSSPGNAVGSICVGSIDITSTEQKAQYSNSGPRVDIWAPGTQIISSVNSGGTTDIRNGSFRVAKYQGTSMASPQVCGVLACILETYPDLTPAEALEYIQHYAKSNQLTDGTGALNDYRSLHGAVNLYLTYNKERKTQGNVFPKLNYKIRPASGVVYPRFKKYK